MRWVFALALVAAAATFASREVRAERWCAWYDWTTSNCGFQTFQQCLDTISGIGGDCRRDMRDDDRSRERDPRERRERQRRDQR